MALITFVPLGIMILRMAGMTLPAFLRLMLPYTSAAALLLCLCVFFGAGKEKTSVSITEQIARPELPGTIYFLLLFFICLQTVSGALPAFGLLLSNFTDQWEQLIIGTNLGGLGTQIASMASLISYKQVAAEYPEQKGRYLVVFTWWNLLFLAALMW